jgi:hypothetical protein
MSSVGLRDVTMMAVLSTWYEGEGMSLTYRLKRTGEIDPEPPHPACLDEMTSPSERTLRTSDPGGRMR